VKALHSSITRAGHRGRSQRGLATVELALVLMPLVLLLSATADLGRAFYTYNVLSQGVRSAARYLALVNPVDDTARTTARNLVLYGNTEASDTPRVPDLTTSMVSICTPATCNDHNAVLTASGTAVNLVSVRISGYAYVSLFSTLLPAKLEFSPINVTMRAHP
jgi:Flp pilus assembly protein TadG